MEKWNKRVKEEMNDWVALYRRQDDKCMMCYTYVCVYVHIYIYRERERV